MRVARLIERVPPAQGGKEIHATSLTRELRSMGVRQHIFCRTGDPLGPGVDHTHTTPGALTRSEPLLGYCTACVRAVLHLHQRHPFDLIHAHGDFPEATAAAYLSARLGIPAVLTIHGGLSRVAWHADLRLPSFSAMEAVVAVSAEVEDELAALGISTRVHRCPSGVREELFDVRRYPTRPPTIVTVGRLAPVKGLETLIAARDLLTARGRDLRWIVAAGGSDAYATRLRSHISERADMSCVLLSDAGEIASLFSQATAFALPSIPLDRQREGVPTALLEAIAGRVPIVASATGGITDLLRDRETALLVEPGSPAALAAAIEETIDDPTAAAGRAADAHAAGIARRWSEVAAEIESIYTDAIARHRRPAALFALPWLDLGGAESLTLSLARGFAERGIRIAVAGAPGRLVPELGDGIEYVQLQRLRSLRAAARTAGALAGACVRIRPQAVNSHHVAIGLLARVGSMAARVRPRHVLTLHTTEDPRMIAPVGLLGGSIFDRVLPVAQGVQTELDTYIPRSRRDRFEVVRVGIEPRAPVERSERTVGVIARLVKRKRHDVLLQAWRLVAADERATGWKLELWGEGPERPVIERAIADLPSVDLVGPVDRAGELVGRFPIVALSSQREGLPLVLVEAMGAGCAVVASDLPGCRELIGEDCGLLVPPGDATLLANALLDLIADPDLRERLASAARKRVESAFSRDAMIDAYLRNMINTTARAAKATRSRALLVQKG